jgi:hypothetical protein
VPIGGFVDNAIAAGGFAVEWNSSRHIITPKEGPFILTPLQIMGVWGLSGMGFSIEGVGLIYAADGSGQAVKITKGREKPNEVSLKLDPLVYENVVKNAVCPPGIRYLFDFQVQHVDPSGLVTFSRSWSDCVVTGCDENTPEDGTPWDGTLKFQPKRRK